MTITALAINQKNDDIAEVVRRLKRIAGVSDNQIGAYLGLHRSVAQQRMSGTSKWTSAELAYLADFFEVPVDLFFMDPTEATIAAVSQHDVATLLDRSPDLRKGGSAWTRATAGQAA